MRPWFETVTDLRAGAEVLRRRRYGVIEVADERLVRVRLRPFAKWISLPEQRLLGTWHHRRRNANRCLLYYNQPWGHANYLALPYVLTGRGSTLGTLLTALATLDEIARIKRSDAIVCDVANPRISDRLLRRWGWEPHLQNDRWHRHWIKRFYGQYPARREVRMESAPQRDESRLQSMLVN